MCYNFTEPHSWLGSSHILAPNIPSDSPLMSPTQPAVSRLSLYEEWQYYQIPCSNQSRSQPCAAGMSMRRIPSIYSHYFADCLRRPTRSHSGCYISMRGTSSTVTTGYSIWRQPGFLTRSVTAGDLKGVNVLIDDSGQACAYPLAYIGILSTVCAKLSNLRHHGFWTEQN